MEAAATAEQIDAVVRHLERLGLKALPIPGAHRTAIAVTGKDSEKDPHVVENFEGVKEVIQVTQPYKLVSRE
ncbi:MAG TPA: 3-deoxy-7-phosphoheptulonate synthase, partial [Thermoanaerobaculia bacterium]|nr:3-deoxy-7-phosphoheptulonate synthase [Thermoanaerobaculia bacterium]